MDKVDFSYLKYPDNSSGRVFGRRQQAHELAKQNILSDEIDYDNASYSVRNYYYMKAYREIAMKEAELVD